LFLDALIWIMIVRPFNSTIVSPMPHLLIVESNLTTTVKSARNKGWLSSGETYGRALQASGTNVSFDICMPYAEDFQLNCLDLTNYDGFVFTDSSVTWSVGEVEATVLRQTIEKLFELGKPILGSCNGLQLANVVLGGQCGPAPKGKEIGVARDINITSEAISHPIHQGRNQRFSALCFHRDHITKLVTGAVISASNDHSLVQAMFYEQGNIIFWGMQYHPELSLDNIINAVSGSAKLFNKDKAFQAELISARENPAGEAAQRLGVLGNDLDPKIHRSELRNWLDRLATTS
jgi:GMP synthase (glutamine-hydrolysing)